MSKWLSLLAGADGELISSAWDGWLAELEPMPKPMPLPLRKARDHRRLDWEEDGIAASSSRGTRWGGAARAKDSKLDMVAA